MEYIANFINNYVNNRDQYHLWKKRIYTIIITSISTENFTMPTATPPKTDCAKSSERFLAKTKKPLHKEKVTVLQVNLGRRCNLACSHCHVEASPQRTEEIDAKVRDNLIEIINRFDQLETVDLTGGAPEMHFGFKDIVKAARNKGKEVIVRSNLTIFFVEGYEWIPEFLAEQKVHIVASLPCYLEDNVDSMRGQGVFKDSIKALQVLNELGFGDSLKLDLVYNPPVPRKDGDFRLAPQQKPLEADYKKFLGDNFNVKFNNLYAITNFTDWSV